MLRAMQNKKLQKKIWIVLLVFILPGFVIWGFSSSIRTMDKTDRGYGKIFKHHISQDEYFAAIRSVEIQLRMQLGDAYYQMQKLFDLKNMALQRLVLLYEADKRRIRVSDAEVAELIQKDQSFHRKGVFNQNLYEQVIKYGLHMQPRAYEEMTRQNMRIRKLFGEVTKGLSAGDAEIKEAYLKENEQVSVYYLAAIPADFVKEISPSETQLKEYFEKNRLDFRKPLSFNLEYLTLDPAGPIKDLSARLDNKETLEKIAQDNALTIKETGLFGESDAVPGIGWSQEITKTIGGLKVGETLGPLEIEKKSYLFRVKDRKEPYVPEFKDIREEVKAQFVKDSSRETAKAKIEECAKKIKESGTDNPKGADFDKLAREFGLKSSSTGLFKFGSYIEGIGASDNFYTSASELQPNAASGMIELPSGFYIIKLKDRPAIDEKKFSEEKAKFGEKFLEDKKQEFFENFMKELIKKSQL